MEYSSIARRRPVAAAGGKGRFFFLSVFRFLPGAPHIERFAVPDVRNRSHRIVARVERESTQQQDVLVASGARTGGYVLYIRNNRLVYEYNDVGHVTRIESTIERPPGDCYVGAYFAIRVSAQAPSP